MTKKAEENQMNIELSEEIASGIYSNLAVITHSPSELICDFIQVMPGMPKGKVKSRVIMTPQNAKRFLKALQDNIEYCYFLYVYRFITKMWVFLYLDC